MDVLFNKKMHMFYIIIVIFGRQINIKGEEGERGNEWARDIRI